jgi:hypothetical protein
MLGLKVTVYFAVIFFVGLFFAGFLGGEAPRSDGVSLGDREERKLRDFVPFWKFERTKLHGQG